MAYQFLLMKKKNFFVGKEDGNRLSTHHRLVSESLRPRHVSKPPCVTKNFRYKRSGSVLKCLHTYLIASMGQTQLRALALLQINYDANIGIDSVTDIFAKNKKRALESVNICDIKADLNIPA